MSNIAIVYSKAEIEEIIKDHVDTLHSIKGCTITWAIDQDDNFVVVQSSPDVPKTRKSIFE